AHLVQPRPSRLSAMEAATLPVAYVTAYQSLIGLAKLAEGERVLIHNATGGVGLAAVQIAQWKGAEIYATAGSPEKRALLNMMGVHQVEDSRSLDFADNVLAATRGEGVDVVLNTLAGDGLAKSLSVLAPYGRHVELSRRDLIDGTALDMRLLARNISFLTLDIFDMSITRPRQAGAVLREVVRLVDAGMLGALPHQVFPVSDLTGAFRHLAQSKQIGKVLLDATDWEGAQDTAGQPAEVVTAPAPNGSRVRGDGSYLVTGGLGDLGRVLVDWLVRDGARHITLVGRSPLPAPDTWATPETGHRHADTMRWLAAVRAHGVDVVYEAADVADEDAIAAVLQRHRATGRPPVRGVVHAAGVVEYQALSDLDAETLSAVLRPKVAGGWVLHRLLADQPLDFFVLFSSGSAILSSPLLGSYAAANAALDTLADHRRQNGAPALSVNWGFWSVGMPARQAETAGRSITPKGMDTFTPQEGVDILRGLLARDATHAVVLAVDWPSWSAAYPAETGSPLLREVLAGPATASAPPAAPVVAVAPVAPAAAPV
ncbi:MAG: MDR/SDR family oxidoreductase, partial [Actinocatenispora sp.]